jgi:predicted transcriptional regulator
MDKKPTAKKITFIYPVELVERLRHLAREHQRSLNGELVWALRQYVQWTEHEQRAGERP